MSANIFLGTGFGDISSSQQESSNRSSQGQMASQRADITSDDILPSPLISDVLQQSCPDQEEGALPPTTSTLQQVELPSLSRLPSTVSRSTTPFSLARLVSQYSAEERLARTHTPDNSTHISTPSAQEASPTQHLILDSFAPTEIKASEVHYSPVLSARPLDLDSAHTQSSPSGLQVVSQSTVSPNVLSLSSPEVSVASPGNEIHHFPDSPTHIFDPVASETDTDPTSIAIDHLESCSTHESPLPQSESQLVDDHAKDGLQDDAQSSIDIEFDPTHSIPVGDSSQGPPSANIQQDSSQVGYEQHTSSPPSSMRPTSQSLGSTATFPTSDMGYQDTNEEVHSPKPQVTHWHTESSLPPSSPFRRSSPQPESAIDPIEALASDLAHGVEPVFYHDTNDEMEIVPDESEAAFPHLDGREGEDGQSVPEDDPSVEQFCNVQSSLPLSGDGLSDLGSGFEHIEHLPDAEVFPSDMEIPSSQRASSPAPSGPTLAQTSPVRGSNIMTTPPRSLAAPQSSPVKSSASFQDLPQPKRATALHHQRQFKKLSAPFRPPQMKVKEEEPAVKSLKREREAEDATVFPPAKKREDSQLKHRTIRAAGQFKSPVVGASAGPQVELVKMTPTIQTLERRVQHLKRATKVRRDGEEEELRGLTAKWTEAGREVAWELWELVKENGGNWNGSTSGGAKRSFEDSWGWSEQGDMKRARTDNWGWDEKKEGDEQQAEGMEIEPSRHEHEEEDKVEWTLGLMLRQFGIDPQTLGWNENDGVFV